MASLTDRLKARLQEVRRRRPAIDHAVRMQQHYGKVDASQWAGAVTYFAFLSFFPIMALAFFVVGYVSKVYPDAQDQLVEAIQQVLPGIIGTGGNKISLDDVQSAAGTVGLIGLAGVLYSGLGWLSSMREALIHLFELPPRAEPNFVVGKLRDAITLAIIGVVLLTSVAVSGLLTRVSGSLLDLVGLDSELSWLLSLLAIAVGLAANMLLFFAMFKLLASPPTPRRSLWSGALLGAIGFEILKQLSSLLLSSTEGQPAFQVFGIALILLVWMNYFSRVVLYAAAWAHTSPETRALRSTEPEPVQGPQVPPLAELPDEPGAAATVAASALATARQRRSWAAPFAAGSAAMLAFVAVVRRPRRPGSD